MKTGENEAEDSSDFLLFSFSVVKPAAYKAS